ncbi:hypothetical protein GOODEAATRI_022809 [Goodea atripinnis]|uniref:Uncharacterized protein n=1 Tax=Goodea atripinnis TaxID=208336 RepID=A0ABV0Q086_9TELE
MGLLQKPHPHRQVTLVSSNFSFPLRGLAGAISGKTPYPFHDRRNFRECDFPSMRLQSTTRKFRDEGRVSQKLKLFRY